MRALFVSLAIMATACGASGGGGSGQDNALGDEFDPRKYPRDCAQDSDCIRVSPLSMCASCCTGDVAVKRQPAEADYAKASRDCNGVAVCTAGCPDRVPVCVAGQCQLKDAGSN